MSTPHREPRVEAEVMLGRIISDMARDAYTWPTPRLTDTLARLHTHHDSANSVGGYVLGAELDRRRPGGLSAPPPSLEGLRATWR